MHHERTMTPSDQRDFETLDALLDGPFAICSVITDDEGRPVDYRFLRTSACFRDTTGIADPEGHTARELVPGLEDKWIERYGRVALDRAPAQFTDDSAATGRDYEVRAVPLDPPGRFAIAFRDVTEARQREREREAALDHAQTLLRELGHRVMNSFAGISAVVAMEARATAPEGRAALDRVQSRVQALASLYRRLDGASHVDRLEVSDYLGGIVAGFRDSLAASAGLEVESELELMTLSTRSALPLGLVVNELLTNAALHAFATGRSGAVRVTLRREGEACRLSVADADGGLAEGAAGQGVGGSLVQAFVGELGGELSTETGEGGTRVTVAFAA